MGENRIKLSTAPTPPCRSRTCPRKESPGPGLFCPKSAGRVTPDHVTAKKFSVNSKSFFTGGFRGLTSSKGEAACARREKGMAGAKGQASTLAMWQTNPRSLPPLRKYSTTFRGIPMRRTRSKESCNGGCSTRACETGLQRSRRRWSSLLARVSSKNERRETAAFSIEFHRVISRAFAKTRPRISEPTPASAHG